MSRDGSRRSRSPRAATSFSKPSNVAVARPDGHRQRRRRDTESSSCGGGAFNRRLNGIESFVDPTVVYFERPEDEQQIAHPAGGDSCTVLYRSEEILWAIWGGEPGLPDEPLSSDATTDLRQRLLLAPVARGEGGDVTEFVVD